MDFDGTGRLLYVTSSSSVGVEGEICNGQMIGNSNLAVLLKYGPVEV
jgi:hypothetical protein